MFLIDLKKLESKDSHWVFPKEGDKLKVQDNVYYVHHFNNEANDAGFGWVWLYNPVTRHYDYKMSVFDRRTIPGNTEIPGVGISNSDAYLSITKQNVEKLGFKLTFKNIIKWFLRKIGF